MEVERRLARADDWPSTKLAVFQFTPDRLETVVNAQVLIYAEYVFAAIKA